VPRGIVRCTGQQICNCMLSNAEVFLAVINRQLTKQSPKPLRVCYNSAFSSGCPCMPRCQQGMHSCPRANGVLEEWCISCSERIDRIAIVDGPGTGDGPQYWNMDADARANAVEAAAGSSWFDHDKWQRDKEMVRAAAHEQLTNVKAVCIEGMSAWPQYIGVFHMLEIHSGWPVFKSDEGFYLYRHQPQNLWLLNDKFHTSSSFGCARVNTAGGLLPLGEQDWHIWFKARWQKQTIAVSLLHTAAQVKAQTEKTAADRAMLQAEKTASDLTNSGS
jgi:hypothetical protein